MSDELKKDLEGDEARLENDEEDVEAHRALKGRALKGQNDEAEADDVEAHSALKGRALKGQNDEADDVEAHMGLKGSALKGEPKL
jgi:hypothetical protein